jgi:hypothetical protein
MEDTLWLEPWRPQPPISYRCSLTNIDPINMDVHAFDR